MSPLVEVERATFAYGAQEVLSDVTLALSEGEVVALLGPNGAGKTTLLRLALGLVEPTRGAVRLRGRDLGEVDRRERARTLAYVPQLHQHSFAYSVLDVVLMGRFAHVGLLGRPGVADHAAARTALADLGISHLAGRPCTELSGGERQLAFLARSLAQGGRMLLMDEPTNALDFGNQVRVLERIAELGRRGYGVAFSTHHPDHALAVADRVVLMRGGRIVRDGPAGEVAQARVLAELYGVELETVAVGERHRVCLPDLRARSS